VEGLVYALCTVTALACAVLLLRGYARSRDGLLLWCGVFFVLIALENAVLFVDMTMVHTNLLPLRRTVGLVAVSVLLYGLVWEGR
jgi:hypothetical protein